MADQTDIQVTREELQTLPRWAIVAWAARMARRAQPFADSSNNEKLKQTTQAAIEFAETAAINAVALAGLAALAPPVDAATSTTGTAAYFAARADAAVHAANTAAYTTDADADAAAFAAYTARYVGAYVNTTNHAGRCDYELLLAVSKAENWTNETPVPPEFFGPLWPNGEPEEIKKLRLPAPEEPEDKKTPVLRLEFTLPADMDKDEADRIISELLQQANELHLAYGGNGLTLAGAKAYEVEPALVPAGGGGGE